MFCSVSSVGSPPLSMARVAFELAIGRLVDRDDPQLDAELVGKRVRGGARASLRVAARHVERRDERARGLGMAPS